MRDSIPRGQIRWWVDRFHVGTPDTDIAAGVARLTRAWPDPADRAKAERWALRAHRVNRARRGRILAGM